MIVFTMSRKHQEGVATLVFSVIVLLIVTFVSLYTAKSVITETKITSNFSREKLAFEAAEAGVSMAREKIKNNQLDPSGSTSGVSSTFSSQFYDDTGSIISSVEVEYNSNLEIVSTGYSDDKTSSRTITVRVRGFDPLANSPENPFISKGSVNFSGSAQIYNQEGATTVWTGGGHSANGSFDTYIADPSDGNYPDCMEVSFDCNMIAVSNKVTGAGVDFIENDTTLSDLSTDEFLSNFTGYNVEDFKNYVVKPENIVNSIPTGSIGGVYWVDVPPGQAFKTTNSDHFGCSVDTTLTKALVIGSKTTPCETNGILDPVLIVVDGDMEFNGGQIYGAVIVLGDFKGGASGDIVGSIMINGDSLKGVGSVSFWYNSDVLELVGNDDNDLIHSVSGGWRDF